MTGVVRRATARARHYRDLARAPGRVRLVVLTLYYLAIIGGLLVVRLTPDYKAAAFVYQAF